MKQLNNHNSFANLVLDKEEQALEDALERGEFSEAKDLEKTNKLFKQAVETSHLLSKSKRITIRVNYKDLLQVKAKAKRNNIPYQTLVGTLIHQYAEGQTQIRV